MTVLCATYARQSIDKAEGIDRQRTRTLAEAQARGWTVVEQYEDNDTSASKARGPKTAWGRMLAAAAEGRFTHVLAVDLDRLLRNQRDLLTLIDSGLKVVSLDGEIDLSTAEGEFRASLAVSLARFEVARKSERQLRANADRAGKAKPNPGRRRYGYETDGKTIREAEAKEVRWMYEHIAQGGSVRAAVTSLKARNVDPGGGSGWALRRVRDTVMNRCYEGYTIYKGVYTPSPEVQPIVTAELAERARAILADPSRKTSPGNVAKHLLSGIAICGACGGRLFYRGSYVCRESAAHPAIKAEILDAHVRDEVFVWILGHPDAEAGAESAHLHAMLTEAAEVREAVAQATQLALIPGADLALVRRTLSGLSTRLAKLDADIARERGALARTGVVEAVRGEWWERRADGLWTEQEQAALDAWPEYWKGLDFDTRREIIKGMFTVTVDKGRGTERVRVEYV